MPNPLDLARRFAPDAKEFIPISRGSHVQCFHPMPADMMPSDDPRQTRCESVVVEFKMYGDGEEGFVMVGVCACGRGFYFGVGGAIGRTNG